MRFLSFRRRSTGRMTEQYGCWTIRTSPSGCLWRFIESNNTFIGVKAPCTSHRLNANYDQVFVVTDNTILFSLQTRIYLDRSIYNGSGQNPWLYMIIYNPDLGLTIAKVDWK